MTRSSSPKALRNGQGRATHDIDPETGSNCPPIFRHDREFPYRNEKPRAGFPEYAVLYTLKEKKGINGGPEGNLNYAGDCKTTGAGWLRRYVVIEDTPMADISEEQDALRCG